MIKINYKKLIIFIVGTFLIGTFFAIFTTNSSYSSLIKPFNIPSYVFPVVWTILYLLMAISLYLVSEENGNHKNAYTLYLYQLIANSLWTLFFFGFDLRLFSFLWIILIIVLVVLMIKEFMKINKTSAYLQIPYFLWLLFAGYLNFSIYILNR